MSDDVGTQAIHLWAGFWHSLYFRHHKQWMWWVGQIPAFPGILMAGKDTIEKSGLWPVKRLDAPIDI